MCKRAAIFLDKDGTIIENVPYNVDPSKIRLCPGALEGLRLLADSGYPLIVVTNQSGVARGYFPESAIGPAERRLRELLAGGGVTLDDFRYCPHHPEGSVSPHAIACKCRKPEPGMLIDAARALGVDLARSWMIGDIADDVEAGRRAGCRTVLLGRAPDAIVAAPDHLAIDLLGAARLIRAVDEGAE